MLLWPHKRHKDLLYQVTQGRRKEKEVRKTGVVIIPLYWKKEKKNLSSG